MNNTGKCDLIDLCHPLCQIRLSAMQLDAAAVSRVFTHHTNWQPDSRWTPEQVTQDTPCRRLSTNNATSIMLLYFYRKWGRKVSVQPCTDEESRRGSIGVGGGEGRGGGDVPIELKWVIFVEDDTTWAPTIVEFFVSVVVPASESRMNWHWMTLLSYDR